MTTLLHLFAALLAQPPGALPPQVGDTWEISRVSETRFTTPISSDGHAYDRDVLIERVVAVRDDGVELEYDLPADATAEERAAVV